MTSRRAVLKGHYAPTQSSRGTTTFPVLPQNCVDATFPYESLKVAHEEIDRLPEVQEHNLGDENVIRVTGVAKGFVEELDKLWKNLARDKVVISGDVLALEDELKLMDMDTEEYKAKSEELRKELHKLTQRQKMEDYAEVCQEHIEKICELKGIQLESTGQ